jgi:N-acetylmuramoyl-L-alanine amidase
MNVTEHKLQSDETRKVTYRESPNTSGKFKPGNLDALVIHFTAGSSAKSSIDVLCNGNAPNRVSAHIVVGRDSSITQLVPFDTIAWHAGPSSYNGRTGFNNYSIGIEIDNAGPLTKQGDAYVSWFGRSYKPEEVFEGIHRNQKVLSYWHRFTEDQIAIVYELCQLLIQTYNIKQILGHEEISPSIKVDPGPAFPLDKMRERLLLSDRADDGPDAPLPPVNSNPTNSTNGHTGLVTVESLNIRSGPSVSNGLVANPLTKGTLLTIIEEKGDWYKVSMNGWVNKKFVKV